MSRDNGLELKVGSFVLMAALALTFFIISISDLSIFEKGRHIQVVFGFASGLREAAPVRLAGVELDAARKIAQGLGAHLEDLQSLVEVSGETA